MLDSFQKLRFSINATNSWCWQFHALNCSLAAEKRMGQAWPDGRELQIWNPKRIGIPKNVSWNSCVEQVCSCMSGSKSKMSHVNEHLSFNHKKRKWSNWHTEHAHIMALHFSFSPYRQHLKDQLRRTWMFGSSTFPCFAVVQTTDIVHRLHHTASNAQGGKHRVTIRKNIVKFGPWILWILASVLPWNFLWQQALGPKRWPRTRKMQKNDHVIFGPEPTDIYFLWGSDFRHMYTVFFSPNCWEKKYIIS